MSFAKIFAAELIHKSWLIYHLNSMFLNEPNGSNNSIEVLIAASSKISALGAGIINDEPSLKIICTRPSELTQVALIFL